MISQWRQLSLYGAVGLSIILVLFPPLSWSGGPDEYGFILLKPPSVRAMVQMLGSDVLTMYHYWINIPFLLGEVAVIWAVYFTLRLTVLKTAAA